MELSRRDAVVSLAAIGIGGGAAYHVLGTDDQADEAGTGANGSDGSTPERSVETPSDRVVGTSISLAGALYPDEVTGREAFVRTYVTGRVTADESHRAGMATAVAALDDRAVDAFDAPVRDLDAGQVDSLLHELGMETVDPDPSGSERERIRYYLVNELLYGLLRSPKGGALAGIENPPGHPGGLDAYREAPQG